MIRACAVRGADTIVEHVYGEDHTMQTASLCMALYLVAEGFGVAGVVIVAQREVLV